MNNYFTYPLFLALKKKNWEMHTDYKEMGKINMCECYIVQQDFG